MTARPREEGRIRDRFGLLLLLLVGSFVALGFAEHTWARVLAGVLQAAALVVAILATRPRQDRRWLGVCALWGGAVVVLEATTEDVSTAIGAIGAAVRGGIPQ